mgnify:CR=1 FL=1
MKKLLFVPLVFILLFSLTACGFILGKKPTSKEKLLSLDDEELFEQIMFRCFDSTSGFDLVSSTDEQKTVYTLMNLQLEVDNGGLCQFFVNSSGECAPYVSEALEKAGALKIKKLYDDFIADNHIDVFDLSSFKTDSTEAFQEQYKRFNFNRFDHAFYEEENLHDLIVKYIRKNFDRIIF